MEGPPLASEALFPLLVQHYDVRMPSVDHPEGHIRFPTSLGSPQVLRSDDVLLEILKQWADELRADTI